MENDACPRIEHADAIDNGVLVYFNDGEIALFSASLLRSVLPQAVRIESDDHPANQS
jgi:hypothetical protein